MLVSWTVVALAALDVGYKHKILICLPDELRNIKKFALAAMSQSRIKSSLLWHFSDTICDDEEVVLTGVARRPGVLWHAPHRLWSCKSFVLRAVSVNGLCIGSAEPEFKSDKEVALAAVRQNAAAFDLLCRTLKADKDMQQAAQSNIDHL